MIYALRLYLKYLRRVVSRSLVDVSAEGSHKIKLVLAMTMHSSNASNAASAIVRTKFQTLLLPASTSKPALLHARSLDADERSRIRRSSNRYTSQPCERREYSRQHVCDNGF